MGLASGASPNDPLAALSLSPGCEGGGGRGLTLPDRTTREHLSLARAGFRNTLRRRAHRATTISMERTPRGTTNYIGLSGQRSGRGVYRCCAVRYDRPTAIPFARPPAVFGVAPERTERVRGHTVAALALGRWKVTSEPGSHWMQGSRVARRAVQGALQTRRPSQAVGIGADADRLGAVLALVVGDLARPWAMQRRKRAPTLRTAASARLEPASEERGWKS
jgi:hypothetical protein